MSNSAKEVVTILQKNQKLLHDFQIAAVNRKEYEVASKLRKLEDECFGLNKIPDDQIKELEYLSKALNMCGLDIHIRYLYAIKKVQTLLSKGDLDLRTAAKIELELHSLNL